MTDFQERVIAERKELAEKCEKLNNFIPGHICKTLPIEEQVRLRMQLIVMLNYGTILAERIAEFHRLKCKSCGIENVDQDGKCVECAKKSRDYTRPIEA